MDIIYGTVLMYIMCIFVLPMWSWIIGKLYLSYYDGVGSSGEKYSFYVVILWVVDCWVIVFARRKYGACMARIYVVLSLSVFLLVFTFWSGVVSTFGQMLPEIFAIFPFIILCFSSFYKTTQYDVLFPCFLWYLHYLLLFRNWCVLCSGGCGLSDIARTPDLLYSFVVVYVGMKLHVLPMRVAFVPLGSLRERMCFLLDVC